MGSVHLLSMKSFKVILPLLLLGTILLMIDESAAQCAMCKVNAENGAANGNTDSAGINFGILYLLSIPYLIISTIAFLVYRHHKKTKKLALATQNNETAIA